MLIISQLVLFNTLHKPSYRARQSYDSANTLTASYLNSRLKHSFFKSCLVTNISSQQTMFRNAHQLKLSVLLLTEIILISLPILRMLHSNFS